MGQFVDDFVAAFTGKPPARSKPADRKPAGERTARVDASTRFARWCWRWRLHLTVLAVPAVWAGTSLAAAVRDPRWAPMFAWWARDLGHQVADEHVAAPGYVRPSPWGTLVWALAALTVSVAVVGGLTLVRTGRWGRLCRREARWRTERLLEHRWEEAMLALSLTSKRFGRTRTPRLENVRATEWGGFEGRVWFPKGFEMGKLAGGDEKMDQLVRRELELPGRGTCEQLVWSLPDEDEATYRVVEVVHRNMPRPDQLQPDTRPADDDNTLRIGVTARGFAGWDMNVQPFLRCSGAPLALDTPIATPTGWTTMGAVKPGDWVFDETGQPTLVVGKSPVFTGRDCYEVVFDDGEVIVSDAGHRWSTWDTKARRAFDHHDGGAILPFRWSTADASTKLLSEAEIGAMRSLRARGATHREIGGVVGRSGSAVQQALAGYRPRRTAPPGPSVVTTAQIASSLRARSRPGRDGEYNHAIPLAGSIECADVTLPIDPWVMGYLLGDGDTSGTGRVACDPVDRDWLMAEFDRCGHPTRIRDCDDDGHFATSVIGEAWRRLGLCDGKRIPEVYLRGSAEQRLALLQGLIDSDGHVGAKGQYRFSNTNERLADGAFELAASLGLKPMRHGRPGRERAGRVGKPSYEVIIPSRLPLARLPRKVGAARHEWGCEQHVRYIVDVRPAESVPVQCITVAADSHLFLAGRAMIPTHNSGKGKGHWSRSIVSQSVQKGWLTYIIDGAGAPEHKPWAGLPNVRYTKLRINAPDEALAAFAGQVAEVQRLGALRQEICDALDCDDWKSLPDDIRAQHPRVLVLFDEFTALMGKAPEDDSTKQLRQHLGWMINRMLRLYRKYGINAVIVDQITYSGTWIGPDGLAQATQFVWCGMPNKVQQRMLSSGARFPTVPNRPGYGMVGVAGELEATPIVWARFDREVVKRIVADQASAWGLAA